MFCCRIGSHSFDPPESRLEVSKSDAALSFQFLAHRDDAPHTGLTSTNAHTFSWHGTGQSLLGASLLEIENARLSVCLEIFIFRDSDVGRRFRSALTEAAKRGVRVQLLIDAVGSFSLENNYFEVLVAAGGSVRRFNEFHLGPFWFRDHRKLLVVDNACAFVGGCNIAPEYEGDGVTRGWHDGGLRVDGPVASKLQEEFQRQWDRATKSQWTSSYGLHRKRTRHPFPHEVEALIIEPGLGKNPLRESLWQDLEKANDVAITAAYFLPPHRLRHRLSQAAARGARVRLLLAGKSDVPLMQLASRSLYARLLKKGIELWEYQPQVLHAKTIVIDDVVYVGSSNLDPRSLRINFEIMLRIANPTLAATVRKQFEADVGERSFQITEGSLKYRHSWWQRLKQQLAYWLFARLDPELAALKLQVWQLRKDRLVQRVRRFRRKDTP